MKQVWIGIRQRPQLNFLPSNYEAKNSTFDKQEEPHSCGNSNLCEGSPALENLVPMEILYAVA